MCSSACVTIRGSEGHHHRCDRARRFAARHPHRCPHARRTLAAQLDERTRRSAWQSTRQGADYHIRRPREPLPMPPRTTTPPPTQIRALCRCWPPQAWPHWLMALNTLGVRVRVNRHTPTQKTQRHANGVKARPPPPPAATDWPLTPPATAAIAPPLRPPLAPGSLTP